MFEYLECLMDGLRVVGGDRIRMPERRRFDPDEQCMFISLLLSHILLLSKTSLFQIR